MANIMVIDAWLDSVVEDYFEANQVHLKLFCNNMTPARDDVIGDYTEATGGGYADIDLAADSHTVVTGSVPHYLSWGTQTFTFTGALTTNTTVYGYYIVNDAEDAVIFAQLLDSPFSPVNNGDYIELNPCKLAYSYGVPA